MKSQPKTVIQALAERVREQAKRFNPALEAAPVAVLWTDDCCDWEGVLPNLKSAISSLPTACLHTRRRLRALVAVVAPWHWSGAARWSARPPPTGHPQPARLFSRCCY